MCLGYLLTLPCSSSFKKRLSEPFKPEVVYDRAMKDELAELERELSKVRQRYYEAFGGLAVILVGGAAVYHNLMHLSWVDAFYFCTITLTTIGYGDIVPTTDVEKIFTIFYVLIGIGVVATFASLLVRHAALRREFRLAKRIKK